VPGVRLASYFNRGAAMKNAAIDICSLEASTTGVAESSLIDLDMSTISIVV
jgi:hypothetical protein